jgi:SAM-dependent methyltransferase
MRDYKHLDRYLTTLAADIYPQPEDEGHTALAYKVIDLWMSRMTSCTSVLDVGCGTGFCEDMFKVWNTEYQGVCLGEDYIVARDLGRKVKKMDFHYLDFPDNAFDLVFARHSLEHSPMPLLALMEWARVARSWLGIILPAPEWYGYKGRNHYSVMNHDQIENLIARAGWKVMWNDIDYRAKGDMKTEENPEGLIPHEYWLMCEKVTI